MFLLKYPAILLSLIGVCFCIVMLIWCYIEEAICRWTNNFSWKEGLKEKWRRR